MTWPVLQLLAQAVEAATAPATQAGEYHLTLGGWVVMVFSVGFVTGLLGWCIWRVMRESTPEKVHSQIDVEPIDKA